MDEFVVNVRGVDSLTPTMKKAEAQVATSAARMETSVNRLTGSFRRWGTQMRSVGLQMVGIGGIATLISVAMRDGSAQTAGFNREMAQLSATLKGPITTVVTALAPVLEQIARVLNTLPAPLVAALFGAAVGGSIGGKFGAIGGAVGFGAASLFGSPAPVAPATGTVTNRITINNAKLPDPEAFARQLQLGAQ
jgi:hypothetical protein